MIQRIFVMWRVYCMDTKLEIQRLRHRVQELERYDSK